MVLIVSVPCHFLYSTFGSFDQFEPPLFRCIDRVSEPLCEPNINYFLCWGLHLDLGRRFARSGDVLEPPGGLLANDRSKAVVLV